MWFTFFVLGIKEIYFDLGIKEIFSFQICYFKTEVVFEYS